MHSDLEGISRITLLAADFDWTWTLQDLGPFCSRTGWQINLEDRYSDLTTNFAVDRQDAVIHRSEGEIKYISCFVTDVASSDTEEVADEVAQWFNRISEVITTTLGISASPDVTDEMKLHWLTPKVVFDLAASGRAVHLKLYDPDYWRFVDEVKQLEAEAYEEYDEDDEDQDED
ncbi:DUF6301 family protein [Nocardia sp. NPDC004123]